ncbi:hypothetical protein [Burkholderia cepacia]|uniref:hypothetical protein n=1 Tax=Burkholderia cepacia TaxID=292 RepID=UPI001CF10F3F|nr:hypothetical protein [Burkholderia cepacia]MCA8349944.1 hypothetical protein [Burkholderia cepacia]
MIEKLRPIEQAQVAAREKLGDMSPRARGEEKAQKALSWVYAWGWSSPSVIDAIGKNKSGGLCTRLVKAGLLERERTASGGLVPGVPTWVCWLTPMGLDAIERFQSRVTDYQFGKIRTDTIRHDFLMQTITLDRLSDGAIARYLPPSFMRQWSRQGVKQPDCIWVDANERRIGVELELTAKWNRQLDQFVLGIVDALRPPNDDSKPIYDSALVLSDSSALLHRYERALQPGRMVPSWQQTRDRKWVEGGKRAIPDDLPEDAIEFELLS